MGDRVALLDDADRKILRELQRDARISFKTIAKQAGVSEATVFVRVRKMQEKGVIKGFTTIVDHASVGKALTAIILVRAKPQTHAVTMDVLKKFDEICEIYDVTGQFYSILKVRASGTDELARIMDEVGKIEGIAGTETIVVLRTIKEEPTIKI